MQNEQAQPTRETQAQENRNLPLNRAIRDHWETNLPKMYAELEASGELDERVNEAAVMTAEALSEAIGKGMEYRNAWEMIANEWAFLPAESEEEDTQTDEQTLLPSATNPLEKGRNFVDDDSRWDPCCDSRFRHNNSGRFSDGE